MIKCPHCETENYHAKVDLCAVPWTNDASSEHPEMTCISCDKVFWVDVVESIEWHTYATEEDYDFR